MPDLCQPLENEYLALLAARDGLEADLEDAAPSAKPQIANAIKQLTKEINRKKAEFDLCRGSSVLTPVEVRIHAIRLADNDGQRRAAITPAQITQWVDRATDVFNVARIRFMFDPNQDWEDVRNTGINNLRGNGSPQADRDAANRLGAQRPAEVVLLFRVGQAGSEPCGPGCGYSAGDLNYIVMPEFGTWVCGHQNITLLAHELGHYFGLPHTFTRVFDTAADAAQALASSGSPAAAFDGDSAFVHDTPPDPFSRDLGCGTATSVTLNETELTLPRDNVMAYWESNTKTLSAGQVRRVRRVLLDRPLTITRTATATIVSVDYNPQGLDSVLERVEILNPTQAALDLNGWTLADMQRHKYRFPPFTLAAGQKVSVWTRDGANDASNLFWRRRAAVWNNQGSDAAILRDAAGQAVSRYNIPPPVI